MTDTGTLKKFLLNDLDDDRRKAVEDLMFSDDEIFQRLCVLDDELVESYVRGELSSVDSQRLFRRLNASERGRRTLDFMVQVADRAQAQAVEQTVAASAQLEEHQPKTSLWQEFAGLLKDFTLAPRAALVTCALLIAAIALPWFQMQSLQGQLETLNAEKSALAGQIDALEQSARDGLAPVQATFSLKPLVRAEGSTEPRISLAPETETLELWLDPGGLITYEELRAILRTHSKDLWQVDGLQSQQRPDQSLFVAVEIPTDLLEPGRYDVILDGKAEDRFHEVARYPIEIAQSAQ